VFRSQSAARLAVDAAPWQRGSLALALASGTLLFLSEPLKLYYSDPFWVKVACLVPAIVFDFTLRSRVSLADESGVRPFWGKLAGLVSIALWSGVAWGGRWIGFSG
jgi:hypothetical protein